MQVSRDDSLVLLMYQRATACWLVDAHAVHLSSILLSLFLLSFVSNHPYLFEGVEDRSLPELGDHLITTSGKMVVLDKLLARFKAQGSRVLIFSQMTRTLDIMEDYLHYRQYPYCRIDGSTLQEDREVSMREFNAEGSDKFVFLLSTRAGGLVRNISSKSNSGEMFIELMAIV